MNCDTLQDPFLESPLSTIPIPTCCKICDISKKSDISSTIRNSRLSSDKERDKEKENQMIEQKYEQVMKAMREEMENKFQQILAKIDVANLR